MDHVHRAVSIQDVNYLQESTHLGRTPDTPFPVPDEFGPWLAGPIDNKFRFEPFHAVFRDVGQIPLIPSEIVHAGNNCTRYFLLTERFGRT
jgi:hypothetical protein